jgi:DUF4097 and DUF4098 domain-containing protein YvlB
MRIGGLEMFGEAFDYPLTAKKATAGTTPQIVIESFRGNARIAGSDTAEVTVNGRKTIRALGQRDADRANQDTPFEVVTNGNQVIIRTNQDRASNSSRVSADLEITVPKGASLTATGRYGDFDVNDLAGAVEINSDNAGIRMQNIGGNVRVDTRRSDVIRAVGVKGSVDLKGRGTDLELQNIEGPVTIGASYVGMVQFRALAKPVRYEANNTEFAAEKIAGQVRMTLSDLNGSNITGPIRLHARSKDVQLTDFTQSVEITVDRGDIELRPRNVALARIEVHTRTGDIEFAVPEKAKLELTATTGRGEITNDYGGGFHVENSGHGSSLKGSLGEGPRVTLDTDRGAITIRKSNGTEQTAVFPNIPSDLPRASKQPKAPRAPVAPETLKPLEQ